MSGIDLMDVGSGQTTPETFEEFQAVIMAEAEEEDGVPLPRKRYGLTQSLTQLDVFPRRDSCARCCAS